MAMFHNHFRAGQTVAPQAAALFEELMSHLYGRCDVTAVEIADREQMILCFCPVEGDGAVMTLQAQALIAAVQESAQPGPMRQILYGRFISSILPTAKPAEMDLTRIYPCVRHVSHLRPSAGTNLETCPMIRPLAGDLGMVLMLDRGETLESILPEEWAAQGLTPVALWDAASRNLRAVLGQFDVTPEAPGYLTIRWPGNAVLSGSILLAPGLLVSILAAQGWKAAMIGAASRSVIRMVDAGNTCAQGLMQADLAEEIGGAQSQSDLLFRLSPGAPYLAPWRIWAGQGFGPIPEDRRVVHVADER